MEAFIKRVVYMERSQYVFGDEKLFTEKSYVLFYIKDITPQYFSLGRSRKTLHLLKLFNHLLSIDMIYSLSLHVLSFFTYMKVEEFLGIFNLFLHKTDKLRKFLPMDNKSFFKTF